MKLIQPNSINSLQDDDVVINLKLFKYCHFYQPFDPNARMIFGWNVHQICYIVWIGILQCLIIYGNVGFFFEDEDLNKKNDYFLILYSNLNTLMTFWRLVVYLYNGKEVSNLLNLTRFDFFTSERCVNYRNTLYNFRDKFRKFTKWYIIFSIVVVIQWFIFPILINMFTISECSNVRLENILNWNFNVLTRTYNRYFVIFYILEANISLCIMFFLVMTNLLLISFCSAIICQQEVLIQAFKNFGHEDNLQTNYLEEFKSILHDQVQLNLKIKSLCSVVKHIVLLTVSCDSISIILLTYRFIMVYMKKERDMALILLKLGSTIFYFSIELFIYCYLFDNMSIQRELVNFSIYSCNWTQMDLKFKKLLLLAMRMNDANNLVIKASPKKIVNLQIFASIMSMTYNVISVMLKTTNKKNEISE